MSIRTKVIEKELKNYAYDLISQYAKWDGDSYYINWNRIPEDEREELIAIMVELDGDEFSIINQNDSKYRDDIMTNMVKMIKSGDMDAKLDFAECVKKAAFHYYEQHAIDYLDEIAGEYTHDTLADNGLCLRQDRDHGDFVVCRI